MPTPVRDTLFGDMPLDRWPADTLPQSCPWSAFAAARNELAAAGTDRAVEQCRQVLAALGLKPRHYLQALHFLRLHGQPPPPDIAEQLLGVVVEVGMSAGLDLLAAYPDHSARYYIFSGAGVVWEHPDASLDPSIDQLLSASAEIVARIGPWDEDRPRHPRLVRRACAFSRRAAFISVRPRCRH